MTAVSKIVCPIGRPRISFSFKVAMTTPKATVIKMIEARATSLKRPRAFIPKASKTEATATPPKAKAATTMGLTCLPLSDFRARVCFFGLSKSKSISIPDKNIKTMTPRLDKKVSWEVWVIRFKQLLPIKIPTMISATAVGTVVTRKRAMTIGITRAKKTVKNSDSPSMLKSISSLITVFLIIQ